LTTDRAKRYAANPSNADTYEAGDLVQVMNAKNGDWLPGVVIRFWRGVTFDGQPANQVDVDGEDKDGPFWGRFDCDHVRRRLQ
jgi:hypothetical protein